MRLIAEKPTANLVLSFRVKNVRRLVIEDWLLLEYGYYWCIYGRLYCYNLCHHLVLHGEDGEEGERDPAWRAVLVDPESHPAQQHDQNRRYEQRHDVIIDVPLELKLHCDTAE